MITPPSELFGLVLAGGRSTRMGRDKALLTYSDGRPQAVVTYELLQEFCGRVYLSVRTRRETLGEWPQLVDRYEEIGPMAGILTALDEHPEAAWLIVACDLPFLNRETLRQLLGDERAIEIRAGIIQNPNILSFQHRAAQYPHPRLQ